MNIIIKSTLLGLLLIASGCDASKTSASEETKTADTSKSMTNQEMMDQGYNAAIFVYDDKSKCPIVMELQESKEKLDPVNIDEDKFSQLRQEGNTVYVKFRRLRMMNRCPEAAPVEIDDLKQR